MISNLILDLEKKRELIKLFLNINENVEI